MPRGLTILNLAYAGFQIIQREIAHLILETCEIHIGGGGGSSGIDDVVVAVAAYYGARRPKQSAGIRRLTGHVHGVARYYHHDCTLQAM